MHQLLEANTLAEVAGGQVGEPISLAHYRWQSHCEGLFDLAIIALRVIRHPQVAIIVSPLATAKFQH